MIRFDPRSDEGFSLVEVVVSLAIFMTLSVAATFAIVGSLRSSHATATRVAGTHVAQSVLDGVRAAGADPITPYAYPAAIASNGQRFTVAVTATPSWTTVCQIALVGGTQPATARDVTVTVTDKNGLVPAISLSSRLACPQKDPR
jgi:type II secretory pathway pseudopilin PulG